MADDAQGHGGVIPVEVLRQWATRKPTIKALYVFGSYARGEASKDSDLDLAFEFKDVEEPDAELISNASKWKLELTALTSIPVKHLYHCTAKPVVCGPTICVFP